MNSEKEKQISKIMKICKIDQNQGYMCYSDGDTGDSYDDGASHDDSGSHSDSSA